MSRSFWKGKYIQKKILKKTLQKIWSRSSSIPFCLVGKRVLIHNGNEFKKIFITREKVGYKFGAFSSTRKFTKKIKIKKTKK
jgi:small subunit ribosomal protein S19